MSSSSKNKVSFLHLRWDLGFGKLAKEWRQFFSLRFLREDLIAGTTVGCVAIPLSLAIALASDVAPAVGLTTSIVAGIAAALFGGTPLAVSGPAAAMAVIIAASVEKFGVGGLIIISLICGALQLVLGTLGLGRLVKFIPTPVVAGFTAGIGVIILVGQLPRALGVAPPDQAHVFDVIRHITSIIHTAQWEVFAVCLSTIFLAKFLPKKFPSLPAPLIAVAVPSLIVNLVHLQIPLIGDIPRFLPPPQVPQFPDSGLLELLGNAFVVFALASLETLLSSSAVDKLSRGEKHDPDQELIGQGISNMFVSFFGGIPVTGVIARSALNVRSGARTRRSAIFHSCFILATIFFFAPVISRIPIAALAGMLIAVAISMIQIQELKHLFKISKGDGAVYCITFLAMVSLDLIAGVQAGILTALFIAVIRMGQLKVHVHWPEMLSPARATLSGPLTFLSPGKFENTKTELEALHPLQPLILDLSRVTLLDASGAEMLIELIQDLLNGGRSVTLKGMPTHWKKVLQSADPKGITTPLHSATESEVEKVLNINSASSPRERLISGVEHFELSERNKFSEVFEKFKKDQKPHTLFITCADSRINPNLITSTEPGELFIVRNVGNIIPPSGTDTTPAEGAALEYAVHVLGVKEIVVCGHSSCGAMAGLFVPLDKEKLPNVVQWLDGIKKSFAQGSKPDTPEEAAKQNVLIQLENLATYPAIAQGVAQETLSVRGWMYDVGNGTVEEWDPKTKTYVSLVSGSRSREKEKKTRPATGH